VGYDLYCEGEHDASAETGAYFRFNIWGMGAAREIMWRAGMLNVEAVHSPFPKVEDFGGNYEDARFVEAVRQVTDEDHSPFIPAYKLGSNDGWLVTPKEIKTALDRTGLWEAVGSVAGAETEEGPDWWGEWIDFLRHTADHGGFRVF
jgi:hypothetical protein